MEQPQPPDPEERPLHKREIFLLFQKEFRLTAVDILRSVRDAFIPTHIREDEGLLSYLGRRAKERKEAEKAIMQGYVLKKEIGSVAARQRLKNGSSNEIF